jgi:hypothetical protein
MGLTIHSYVKNPGANGKFVVLLQPGNDDGILVLSDFTRDFQHRDVVARWETEAGRGLAASGLRVAGGGWWRYETPDFLILYGQSAAYGRFDPKWLRERFRPGMVGAESRIDIR